MPDFGNDSFESLPDTGFRAACQIGAELLHIWSGSIGQIRHSPIARGGGQVGLHISIGRPTAVDLDQNSHSSPWYSLYSIFGVGSSWAKNNRDDIVRSAGIGGIHILLLCASNPSEKLENCNRQLLQRRTVLPRNSKGDESNVSVAHGRAPRFGSIAGVE